MAGGVTTIDLMRHGEPVGGCRYRGQLDDPLSGKGWRQMREVVGGQVPWQQIVTSPLSRCHAFAPELSEQHGLPLSVDARFMEVQFGEWEGQSPDGLKARDPDSIARCRRDPIGQRPAGAEPLEAFRARVSAGWNDLLAAHAAKHVLLLCHAGVIRMAFAQGLGVPLARTCAIDVPGAGITRFTVEGEGRGAVAQLRFHADSL